MGREATEALLDVRQADGVEELGALAQDANAEEVGVAALEAMCNPHVVELAVSVRTGDGCTVSRRRSDERRLQRIHQFFAAIDDAEPVSPKRPLGPPMATTSRHTCESSGRFTRKPLP